MKRWFCCVVSFSMACLSCSFLPHRAEMSDNYAFSFQQCDLSSFSTSDNKNNFQLDPSHQSNFDDDFYTQLPTLNFDSHAFCGKWYREVNDTIDELNAYRMCSFEYNSYCFFTDPHFFWHYSDQATERSFISKYMSFLKYVSVVSNSDFVVCGGDLLNNGDSISQACNDLSFFNDYAKSLFQNYYYIVGNHDTNYQGDSFIYSGDFNSCLITNDTIERLMFNGNKAYYSFETETTKYFCFDSGIDWDSGTLNSYRVEQIRWFAEELLTNKKPHLTIFVHIPAIDGVLTALMSEIGNIIYAFNMKGCTMIEGTLFDYSSTIGSVDFVQSGHLHSDESNLTCGGVPVIVTTSFSHPDVVSRPTFDLVFVDYSNSLVHCLRIGEGENRTFSF